MQIAIKLLVLALALSACTHTQPPDALYQQLGAQAGITRIVNSFVQELQNDPETAEFFKKTKMPRFKEKLAEQLCQVSGGPCTYTGDTMQQSHEHLLIQPRHFNKTVEHLMRAMDNAGITTPVQNQLLARLAPLHRDIVNTP
jgi:hemoglobin